MKPAIRTAGIVALSALTFACLPALFATVGNSPKPVSTAADRLEIGGTQVVDGHAVTSWATIGPNNAIHEVGVTVPLAVAQTPPAKPGKGPLGAIAVIDFPKDVQQNTYFNHFEMHWNPNGHPPACCFGVAHFDMHFYAVPLADVWKVKGNDPALPKPGRLPAGYIYPGRDQTIPMMGVHTAVKSDFKHVMIADMVAGFWNGDMTFVEPMITRKRLLEKKSFELAVPTPKVIGRHTLYPTRFEGIYDEKAAAYRLIFSGFKQAS